MENITVNGIEYTPVTKETQIINMHYHFELSLAKSHKKLTWKKAVAYVNSLGDGWRLPTIEECFMIYHNKLIDKGYYWSSTEFFSNVYVFNFKYGKVFDNDKEFDYYVCAVRDIKSE